MIIRYDCIGDQILVNVLDGSYWEIRFRLFDEHTPL